MNGCPSAESLLAHTQWLQRLVRTLVRDGDEADDVLQQTWLQALLRPPDRPDEARPWLARVARNIVRKRHREERRRDVREGSAARGGLSESESTASIVERAVLHRAVVDAVLSLHEPYRTTLLRRFFDDMPPRAIARLESCSVETVRSRVQRGLARLREKLERRGIRSPGLCLVALARPLPSSGAQALAGSAAAVLLLAVPVTLMALGSTGSTRDLPAADGIPAAIAMEASTDWTAMRTPLPVDPDLPPPTHGDAGARSLTVRGPLRDLHGRPVPFATVLLVDPAREPRGDTRSDLLRALDDLVAEPPDFGHRTRSDAAGRFVFEGVSPKDRWTLAAVHPELGVAVRTGLPITGDLDLEAPLELEGGNPIRGQLVDLEGTPVRGAGVLLHGFVGSRASPIADVLTDSEGRFVTPALRFDALALSVGEAGYLPVVMAPFQGHGQAVRLTPTGEAGEILVPGYAGLPALLEAKNFPPEVVPQLIDSLTVGDGAGSGTVLGSAGRYVIEGSAKGEVYLKLGSWTLARASTVGQPPALVVDPDSVREAPRLYRVDTRIVSRGGGAERTEVAWLRTPDPSLPVPLEGSLAIRGSDGKLPLLAGHYRLHFAAPGWAGVDREITVEGDPRLVVDLGEPAVEVRGALESEGTPVADALVELLQGEGLDLAATTRTNRDGAFSIEGLRPGTYYLVATAERGPADLATARAVRAPTPQPVALRMPEVCRVRFETSGDGGPFWIRIEDQGGFPLHDDRRQGDNHGGNEFLYDLAIGARYQVVFETEDGRTLRRWFEAAPGLQVSMDPKEIP